MAGSFGCSTSENIFDAFNYSARGLGERDVILAPYDAVAVPTVATNIQETGVEAYARVEVKEMG